MPPSSWNRDPLFILAVLAAVVALAEILVRRTSLRHLGTALVVILLAALAVNVGLIPPAAEVGAVPIYGGLLGPVAKLAIFWLLLRVNLSEVRRAGGAMIGLFVLGALGTFAGVLVGMTAVGAIEVLGDRAPGMGAMFVGTYTGGSVNFTAMAQAHDIQNEGVLFAAATAVDNLMTTLWMAVTLIVPRLLRRGGKRTVEPSVAPLLGVEDDTESVHPLDLSCLLALGAAVVWGSEFLAGRLALGSAASGIAILILTTVALLGAQLPFLRGLRGTRTIGMFAVYLFLAAIGALCDLQALRAVGDVGLTLLAMVAVALTVHGLVIFCGARLLHVTPEVAAVASQANVGGSTSALALARSLGRADLVLPAILVGSLGSAIGNYLGLAAGYLLQ